MIGTLSDPVQLGPVRLSDPYAGTASKVRQLGEPPVPSAAL
jgi:hypothetical protein